MQDQNALVAIGASAGGVSALLEIAAALPGDFPAPICVVQHIGGHSSVLPELLQRRGPLPAVHAADGDRLAPGRFHVAPPDHHLLLRGDVMHLTRGPKQNFARPAIDPLFRTVALDWGARAIGVVLTGQLDDGTAGLKAIKEQGGTAIVQDPTTAVEPDMPASALAHVSVDHCVQLDEIAPLLRRLVGAASRTVTAAAGDGTLVHEVAIERGDISIEHLAAIARPSSLTCPDCDGSLWEMNDKQPLRYRCHVGHAYTASSLRHGQKETAENSLWSTVRALREREMLLRRVAAVARETGDPAQASAGEAQADRLRMQIEQLAAMARGEMNAEQA
ncbi:chemotaxis protein CheB [Caenimonas sedimenti]|nr:chemotaxis protein CheB [Caenimonas sedimenti]